jgi:hypothetical protein
VDGAVLLTVARGLLSPSSCAIYLSFSLLLQLSNPAWTYAGLHPELTSGLLWPSVLSVILADGASSRVRQLAANVMLALWTRCAEAKDRPQIPASAAAAIASELRMDAPQFQPLSGMSRLDSDSLALCFSFLCGCDWFRTMRVCRRFVSLRFKPTAWPSSLPCGRHTPQLVQALVVLQNHVSTAVIARDGVSRLDSEGSVLCNMGVASSISDMPPFLVFLMCAAQVRRSLLLCLSHIALLRSPAAKVSAEAMERDH